MTEERKVEISEKELEQLRRIEEVWKLNAQMRQIDARIGELNDQIIKYIAEKK